MLEEAEKNGPSNIRSSDAGYSYPRDLALFVRERWNDLPEPPGTLSTLLDATALEDFLSACYHASMLREEERPVTFRAILARPALFAPEGRPPEGLQRLDFFRPLPFRSSELKRLSVTADLQRTLIGVQRDEAGEGDLQIWGLINSGTRWLRDVQGGRRAGAPLPPVPVVHVEAPGSIEVYKGNDLVGKLHRGRLAWARENLFDSQWLPEQFSRFQRQVLERHELARIHARETSGERWAPLEESLPRRIAERMLKRVIAVLRAAHHGGTIVFVPLENAGEPSREESYIDLRYRFAAGRPRLCFPDLIVEILNRFAKLYGDAGGGRSERVGWREFEETTDEAIATLDEALFETAHLIAGLAAADGAVVLSKEHELLGFGGMISGRLPAIKRVARALDLEGEMFFEEETRNVGARHRSAYLLAAALPGALAVVVSQDGGVRFVRQKGGRVIYWNQE